MPVPALEVEHRTPGPFLNRVSTRIVEINVQHTSCRVVAGRSTSAAQMEGLSSPCHQRTSSSRTLFLPLFNGRRYRAEVGPPDILRKRLVYETIEMVCLASAVVVLQPFVCCLAVHSCSRAYEE